MISKIVHVRCIFLFLCTIMICGCSGESGNGSESIESSRTDKSVSDKPTQTASAQNTETVQKKETDSNNTTEAIELKSYFIEAEETELFGKVKIEKSTKGFTGKGYLKGFEGDEDKCIFNIYVDASGFYDLNFRSATIGGYKENYVIVDGSNLGVVSADSSEFADSVFTRVYLEVGEHTVELLKYWGWIMLDSLAIVPSEQLDYNSFFDVSAELINPNADDNTKRLMSYLSNMYGEYILTGQYCDTGIYGKECQVIKKETDKLPAVLGLDMMDYSLSRVANGSNSRAVEYAVEHDEHGGIVTFCWHWNAPSKYITGIWWKAFYAEATNIDLKKIMDGEDKEGYDLLIEDIDAISEQLKILHNAGVPVLWRPLHEASGGWFWWGASGAEACKQLWILMYDRMTNVHKLNNLIWLWNGQGAEWYPGDGYVDIIGEDIYAGEKSYSSQIGRFMEAANYTDAKKMIVLSENGTLVNPDLAIRDGAVWGFFATWAGDFVVDSALWEYSEKYSELSMLKKVYAHEKTITLDELPNLKKYQIK